MSTFQPQNTQFPHNIEELLEERLYEGRHERFARWLDVLCSIETLNDMAAAEFFSEKSWKKGDHPRMWQPDYQQKMLSFCHENDGALAVFGLGLAIQEPLKSVPRPIKVVVVVEDDTIFRGALQKLSESDWSANGSVDEALYMYASNVFSQLHDWYDLGFPIDTNKDFVLSTIRIIPDLHCAVERLSVDLGDEGALGRIARAVSGSYLREHLAFDQLGVFRADDDTLYPAHPDIIRDLSEDERFLEFDLQPWRDTAVAYAALASRKDLRVDCGEYRTAVDQALKKFRANLRFNNSRKVRARAIEILQEVEDALGDPS